MTHADRSSTHFPQSQVRIVFSPNVIDTRTILRLCRQIVTQCHRRLRETDVHPLASVLIIPCHSEECLTSTLSVVRRMPRVALSLRVLILAITLVCAAAGEPKGVDVSLRVKWPGTAYLLEAAEYLVSAVVTDVPSR